MATYYSDHFADTSDYSALVYPTKSVAVGICHARKRWSRASFVGLLTTATTDIARMLTLRSSDRLIDLYLSTDAACAAGAVDIGLYLRGGNHDGAVVDADLFASAVDVHTAAFAPTSILNEATTITTIGYGLPLWEQAALGAATYTSDPGVLFDIVISAETTMTTTATTLILEALYSAGD